MVGNVRFNSLRLHETVIMMKPCGSNHGKNIFHQNTTQPQLKIIYQSSQLSSIEVGGVK